MAGVPVVLLAALLPGCSTDPDSLGTTLVRAADATVEHADGTRSDARSGLELRRGDVVRTGDAGSAELATGGRRLLMAASTDLRVGSGTGAQLLRGAGLVDTRRGPRLRLDAGPVAVATPQGTVARIERGAAVRIGVFEGRAAVASDSGRSLDVDALHQVQAAGRTLPDRPSPLTLVGDAWERRVAPELVATDGLLRALATGIDSDPVVRPAIATVSPNAVGPPSERVLPTAIAEASENDRSATAVRNDRTAGGSWGVVAALAVATGSDVGRALDELLATVAESPGAERPGAGPSGSNGSGATPGASGDEPAEAGDGDESPGAPGATGRPRPRPTPTPAPSPTEEPDLVEQAIATVESALPIPLPPVPVPPVASLVPLPLPLG